MLKVSKILVADIEATLKKVEALLEGASTPGERQAAEAAYARLLKKAPIKKLLRYCSIGTIFNRKPVFVVKNREGKAYPTGYIIRAIKVPEVPEGRDMSKETLLYQLELVVSDLDDLDFSYKTKFAYAREVYVQREDAKELPQVAPPQGHVYSNL